MRHTTRPFALLSLLLASALFGFFYAWVCSTMWGLDAADPRVAIAAMQAMNASVRNAIFAPAFFGTTCALLLTTGMCLNEKSRKPAFLFALATLLVGILGVGLTFAINVPMNTALAQHSIPQDIDAARIIWQSYSPDWQFWNQMRTLATGCAVLCIGFGLLELGKQ